MYVVSRICHRKCPQAKKWSWPLHCSFLYFPQDDSVKIPSWSHPVCRPMAMGFVITAGPEAQEGLSATMEAHHVTTFVHEPLVLQPSSLRTRTL